MAKTPERRVKDKFEQYLDKKYPDAWYFMHVPSGYGKAGIPDYIGCIPRIITQEDVGKTLGHFMGVEIKAGKGKATPLQRGQLEEIAAAGGVALIITGEDLKVEEVTG